MECRIVCGESVRGGEVLQCCVSIQNSSSSVELSLEWLSLQCTGWLTAGPSWIKLPRVEHSRALLASISPSKATSQDNERCVFWSGVNIVGSDVIIPPSGRRTFVWSCLLPNQLLPSFHCSTSKCRYTVTATIQPTSRDTSRGAAPLYLLSTPVRVLNPFAALKTLSVKVLSNGPLAPSSHSITAQEVPQDIQGTLQGEDWRIHAKAATHQSQLAEQHAFTNNLQLLKELFHENAVPVSVNISKGEHHLVKLCLNKKAFQLGELIRGTLDFTNSSVLCHQVSIRLEMEETIEPMYRESTRGNKPIVKTITESHSLVANSLLTSFTLSIPVSGIPEFSTDFVTVKWQLHFEFITGKTRVTFNQPIEAEALHWTFPIRVLVIDLPPEHIYKTHNNEVTRS